MDRQGRDAGGARQCAGVVHKNIVYVIDGNTNSQNRIATVKSYDPTTDSWTDQPSLRDGQSERSAGVIGDTIVAADGFATREDSGDTESFMVGATSWTALPNDPGACTGRATGRARA